MNEQSLTVCLVDDDQSVLKATSRLIRSAGWEVAAFDDALAFLTHAEAHRPPVVVLDVWMPVIAGLEVQTLLRKYSPTTKVIFMTGTDDRVVREKAMSAGAFAFFLKPATDSELLAAIESAVAPDLRMS